MLCPVKEEGMKSSLLSHKEIWKTSFLILVTVYHKGWWNPPIFNSIIKFTDFDESSLMWNGQTTIPHQVVKFKEQGWFVGDGCSVGSGMFADFAFPLLWLIPFV